VKIKKFKIGTRIFTVFTALLLSFFVLIGFIVNVATGLYIQSNAVTQLESAENLIQTMEQMMPEISEQVNSSLNAINAFRIEANLFPLDETGNPLDSVEFSNEMTEITRIINGANISLKDLRNQRVRTDNGIYYVSARYMTDTPFGENIYWIIYADVTGLMYFANAINFFLIVLVCIMFAISVIIIFFLSNSIIQPINKLSSLATNIGRGDFTPKDFKFTDIEFENLNMTLNKTAKQLGIYDSEQKAFFQNASHELRTPLMAIKCYAEGISYDLMEPKKASETILQETDRLAEMVMDLLYISKIDNITSAYITAKVDLLEIIRACTQQQKAISDTKQVRLSFDFNEPHIFYDCVEELISRAVNNLLSNAIRYAKSEIILSCHKKANQIIISISDDGFGIEPESIPHLFERFYKGTGGIHGIGLSLVKSIAEQHSGHVKAKNSINGGASFTITLPCSTRR
jgi:signal transduction histidine kinase